MNLFTLVVAGYLTLLASLVWQIFRPPACTGDRCIIPMFQQEELENCDFYFFVTDDSRIASSGAQVAKEAAAVMSAEAELVRLRLKKAKHQASTNTTKVEQLEIGVDGLPAALADTEQNGGNHLQAAEVLKEHDEDEKFWSQRVSDSPLKYVTSKRRLDLSGGALGGILDGSKWEQRLRMPVFASTRNNATLYGLFFLCPGERPLDPASYPTVHNNVASQHGEGGSSDVAVGSRLVYFEEAVLFTASALTKHTVPQKQQTSSMLLNKKTLAGQPETSLAIKEVGSDRSDGRSEANTAVSANIPGSEMPFFSSSGFSFMWSVCLTRGWVF